MTGIDEEGMSARPRLQPNSEETGVNHMKKGFIFGRLTMFAAAFLLAIPLAPSAKRYIENRRCGKHLAAIYQAARVWADAHDGRLPSGFTLISNELVTPRLLLCPGDKSREPADNWREFASANSSYAIWEGPPGAKDLPFEIQQSIPCLQCKVHGFNYANALGKVFVASRPSPFAISLLAGLSFLAFLGGSFWHRLKPVRSQPPIDTTTGDLLPRLGQVRHDYLAARGKGPSPWYRNSLLAAARHASRALAFFADRKHDANPEPQH